MKTYTPTSVTEMFLDYKNNHLTIKLFSEYYQITEETAINIVNTGKQMFNLLSELNKTKS